MFDLGTLSNVSAPEAYQNSETFLKTFYDFTLCINFIKFSCKLLLANSMMAGMSQGVNQRPASYPNRSTHKVLVRS